MCWFNYQARRWQNFKPSKEYLSVVNGLTTIEKLHNYIKKFHYEWDTIKILWWKILWDYWQTPEQTLKREAGDCLEADTAIITKSGFKKIKDINIGDLVLSYNFDIEKYEYKKVINKWDKGILDGYIVKLRNGHDIISTGGHRFFCRIDQKNNKKYKIKKLNDIDITRWWRRQIYSVFLLPEGNLNINKDLAYLYGIYITEGYFDRSHIRIAQDKKSVRIKIERALNNLKVPYSKSKRIIHAYYTILNSNIKEDLKKLGTSSFDKKLPLEVLSWNKESLKFLIEGMLDGDGTNRNKKWNHGHDLWEFSTSSEQVAKIFNIICRKVYGNCWFYKQENHQGIGNKPIYRLRYNPKSLFNKEIYEGISSLSIKSLTKIFGKHYYDIEVEDNHNFVLTDSGIISHNCEDSAIFNCDILGRVQNIDAKMLLLFGYNRKRFGWKFWMGHAVCIFPYQGRYSMFSNQSLTHGYDSYEQIGHSFYPDGLKYMEVRNHTGKVLSRKFKLFGKF